MKTLLTTIALLTAFMSFSQTLPPFEYLDKNYKITTQTDAAYFVVLEQDRRLARNNKTAFYPDGKKRRYQEFSNYAAGILDGISEEYYPSGKIMSSTRYEKGVPTGTAQRFWEDGTVKREMVYVNGAVVSEKCFDREGKEVAVYPMHTRPEFPGGVTKFYTYIIKNISTRNMSPTSTGKITASFIIGPDGKLSDIKILRGINKLINAAYVDVLKKSPLWKPALEENEPVAMELVMPLNLIPGANNDDFYTAFEK